MSTNAKEPERDRARQDRGFKRHGTRYKARRRAVDILYEAEARDVDPVALVDEYAELAREPESGVRPINDYTRVIVGGAAEELDFIDEVVTRTLTDSWELHRLPAVDRAILRMSIWELLFNEDVPTRTAVVEGVEIASQYSHPKAAAYVNATLDDVARNLDELRALHAERVAEVEHTDNADETASPGSAVDAATPATSLNGQDAVEPDAPGEAEAGEEAEAQANEESPAAEHSED